jgi:hypothetical protein
VIAGLAAAAAGGTTAAAQGAASPCAGFSSLDDSRRVCQAAADLVQAYTPIAGVLMSGGNPVLGGGGAMRGLGHFSVAIRANATRLVVPDLRRVSASGTVPARDTIGIAPAPQVDASAGLYRGLASGLLAVDLLATAQLVPNEKAVSGIRVDPDAPRIGPVSLGLGVGARVGVLPERGPLPGVAVSVMHRGIPVTGYGDVAAGDDLQADLDLHATDLRATVGKHFSALALVAGLGWSHYGGTARAAFRSPTTGLVTTVAVPMSASRAMIFADAGVKLGPVQLVGELGRQSGMDQELGTRFTGFDDTAGTTFYSLGLRAGF